MRATIESTDRVVPVTKDGKVYARVWEGVTANGAHFTAYITMVQVLRSANNSEFERDLREHKAPESDTQAAVAKAEGRS